METKIIARVESYSYKDGLLLLSIDNAGAKVVTKDLMDNCNKNYNGYIKLKMSKPYRDRSLGQNDLYWSRCTAYAKYIGSTKDEVSKGVKWRACDEGLWELVDVPFSKTGRKEPKSTADADVQEMSVLLDVLDRIASEDGFLFEF